MTVAREAVRWRRQKPKTNPARFSATPATQIDSRNGAGLEMLWSDAVAVGSVGMVVVIPIRASPRGRACGSGIWRLASTAATGRLHDGARPIMRGVASAAAID